VQSGADFRYLMPPFCGGVSSLFFSDFFDFDFPDADSPFAMLIVTILVSEPSLFYG
jgi:hypothetical protein